MIAQVAQETDVVAMFPQPVKIMVTGKGISEEVAVTQIYVGQIRKVMELCIKFMPLFRSFSGGSEKSDLITDLFMEHTDDAVQLIALCSGRPLDWCQRLDVDSALTLFLTIVEVNVDFFLQRVLPTVVKAVAQATAFSNSVEKAGLTASKSSSPKDMEITNP